MIPNIKYFEYEKKKFSILSNTTAYAILEFIKNGPKNVTEISERFNLVQCVCSLHLSKLRNIGAVETARDGKEIYYSIDEKFFKSINKK